MNKFRRAQLRTLAATLSQIESVQERDMLEDCIGTLEDIRYDEEEYFENMPENLQGSTRGYAAEEAIDNMDQAIESLNDALDADENEDFLDDIGTAIQYIWDCI